MEAVRNASTLPHEKTKFMQQSDATVCTESDVSNNNNNQIDLHDHDDNGNHSLEEDLHLGDTSNYTPEERNTLFQKGLEYERNFKSNAALQCYLGCIQGLKNTNMFLYLPQCLHKIADFHSSQESYDCVAQCTQAENLYHETSVCETDKIQQKIDEIAGDSSASPTDLSELNIDALRAEEYEHLARLCWLKKQCQLALEYAGRCTKMRQQIYGKNHEKTKSALNFFATVYAKIEKQQYSESLVHAEDLDNKNEPTDNAPRTPEVIMSSSPVLVTPVSILRQRSEDGSKETEREKKQVRFHESVDDNLRLKEKDDMVSISLTLVYLAICIVIVASMCMWLYCSLDQSQSCQTLVSQFQNWVRTVQYYYRSVFNPRRPT